MQCCYDTLQDNELGDDAHITKAFFKSLKLASKHPSLWTWMVKFYPNRDNNVTIQLEKMYGMLDAYFSTLLR